ncbi:hypothetical protein [Pseudonocardia sp. MH-G8]|uniref:hypothetical protein n=1 Tax=Pseudonocardia sp. MH-G8 TaxID=1854588 RepID=UPI00117BB632|nr:hypothetical protein [Pseudonocardia sp. MH-G8]
MEGEGEGEGEGGGEHSCEHERSSAAQYVPVLTAVAKPSGLGSGPNSDTDTFSTLFRPDSPQLRAPLPHILCVLRT